MLSSTKVNAFRTFYDSILVVLSSSCRRVAICRIILSEFFLCKKKEEEEEEERKERASYAHLRFSLVSKQQNVYYK